MSPMRPAIGFVEAAADMPRQLSGSTFRLRDGRTIGYLQVGKADGPAIFHFHGHGSSRLEALLVAEKAADVGVRLIALDRPGIGRSSANEGYRLLDWPDDVAEVAHQLGIGRFAVEGFSAGGAFALACAYKYPHRLTACGLISSLPPGALVRKAGPLWMRSVWWIGEHCPSLFQFYLGLLPDRARDERTVEKQLLRIASHLAEADRTLLRTPELRSQLVQAMVESRRQGSGGNRYEAMLKCSPGASNPERSHLKRYSYGTEDRIASCRSLRLVSWPANYRTAPRSSIPMRGISRC